MRSTKHNWIAVFGALPLLCACGGGGGGGVGSTPPPGNAPAPAPTPTPTPTPPPPFQPTEAKLFQPPPDSGSLVTMSEGWIADGDDAGIGLRNVRDAGAVTVQYNRASGTYSVQMPWGASGTIYQTGNAVSHHQIHQGMDYLPAKVGNAPPAEDSIGGLLVLAPGGQNNPYKYVTHAWWDSDFGGNSSKPSVGTFGVAIPTRAGDVPVTGKATYRGHVMGALVGNWDLVVGTSRFDFDFASASLQGQLNLDLACLWGCTHPTAVYEFTNTVFSRGSTSFSGKLKSSAVSGLGEFSGIFAGPGAAELLARFETPFFNAEAGVNTTAYGVILGKKH